VNEANVFYVMLTKEFKESSHYHVSADGQRVPWCGVLYIGTMKQPSTNSDLYS